MRIVVFVLLLVGLVAGYSHFVSLPQFSATLEGKDLGEVKIADASEALTFARTENALILVNSIEGGVAEGINLTDRFDSQDPVELVNRLDYDALAALLDEPTDVESTLAELQSPLIPEPPFVAAGTNYSEHAEEVYLDDPPFLFPKMSQPSHWNAAVSASGSPRLDYEAELCLVPLQDLRQSGDRSPFGLLLCNDFTDRWLLLEEINLDAPMGTTGFASAKGKPGFLPLGFLLVVPRDNQFLQDIRLELYVNGLQRQQFRAGEMILSPEAIIDQAFSSDELAFYRGEQQVPLIPNEGIKAGSLILTGTAAGVIFKPVNVWNSMYYLAPGDEVVTRAPGLGHLLNRIVSE